MPAKMMRGVYPILVTPFDKGDRVDVESLQRLVDFQVDAGVHGLGVALGSEVFKFTEDERRLVAGTVVRQVAGRIPVVINTGSESTSQTIAYSRMAEEDGADALMIMPPTVMAPREEGIVEYYSAISAAVGIPIFVQDTSRVHVSANAARRLAQETDHVKYIKVESLPTTEMVQETVQKAGDTITVFGGAGGNYFIEEMRRGSVGTMPGCSNPEAFVKVWNLYWAGDEVGARDVFYRRILPINRISVQSWGAFYHVHKEILRRRGAIGTNTVRGPVVPLDEVTRRELDAVIDELYPS